MKPGFLTLQRKFFDHWLWTEPRQFSRAEAWLDLLRSAAFADHSRIIRGSLVTVNRGEIVASLRYLGERWGWKKDKVNTFVRLLESATMIRRETRQQETVLILCNYDTYNIQTGALSDSQQAQSQTANRQSPDNDPTKDNKGNKGKKEIPPNPQGVMNLDDSENRSNRKRYATHAEVTLYAQSQPMGISEDCIDAFFDRMEEIGWTDDKGLPLADWRARFRRYATNWHNNRNQPNKNNR